MGKQRDFTIPQAMLHAGIKSRNTFNKYRALLAGSIKKPGVGSKRHLVSYRLAEQIRLLHEDPLLLAELTRSTKRDRVRDAVLNLLQALRPDELADLVEDTRQEEAVRGLGEELESIAAAEGIAAALTLLFAQNPMLEVPALPNQDEGAAE